MGGITNYYDGETGVVSRVEWKRDYKLFFYIYLKDNPYRKYALDYDSDIHIDSTIKPGDQVIYKKTGEYGGFWFKIDEERPMEEIFRLRHKIREKKYKQLFLPITLTVEIALSIFLSAIVTIAFYIFRHKPGEEQDLLFNITFLTIFLSLSFSCFFRLFLKYPTFSELKSRGISIIWDMIKFLAMEIVYVIVGILIFVIVSGLTVGLILKIFTPNIYNLIETFIISKNNVCYLIIGGFSFWAIIHLVDFTKIHYSPEGFLLNNK